MHKRRQKSPLGRSTSGRMVHPCDREAWELVHPSDGKVWKKFDQDYKDFAANPRHIRCSVSTDDYTPYPFKSGTAPPSSWSVSLNILNGPPGSLLNPESVLPTLIIPGPEVPSYINAMVQPLIKELLLLWEGVQIWDGSAKEFLTMRGAVLWHHDFPDYSDYYGWGTRRIVGADICGCCSPISSQKVQKRSDDYSSAVSAEHRINGGLPHGHVPTGGGDVCEAFTETLKLDTPPPPGILQGGAPAQVVVDGTDSMKKMMDATSDGKIATLIANRGSNERKGSHHPRHC